MNPFDGLSHMRSSDGPQRRGALSFELLLILPVILLILWGVIEFSLCLAAQQRVSAAAREAARMAAVGASPVEIETAANASLGPGLARRAQTDVADRTMQFNGKPGQQVVVVQVNVPDGAGGPQLFGFGSDGIIAQVVMRKE